MLGRERFAFIAALLVFFVGAGLGADPAAAQTLTFTVNSVGDGADAQAGNGVCETSTGVCTLRAAIEEANLHTGPDTIAFNIPGTGVRTIQLASPLPAISDTTGGTTIDGYTQPGSAPNTDPWASNATITVEVTTAPGTFTNSRGLYVTSPANTIRGLAVFNVKNPLQLVGRNATNNTVAGNFIGTDAAGNYAAVDYSAAGDGILMLQGARHNTIGGTAAADRNVVSGNPRRGVVASGETTDFNRIINNIVGLGPDGNKRLANIKHGVDLNSGASDNVVGGTEPGERNILSGNGGAGIEVSHLSDTINNRVIGNFIGTGITGNTAPAYSSNGDQGVHLQDQVLNNEVAGNVIGNNLGEGIRAAQRSSSNQIHDNWIGVSPDNSPIPNFDAGVKLGNNADSNDIGPNNTIANNAVGIVITTNDSDFNTITRNSLYGNQRLGIDLFSTGPNQNDPGDADSGPNEQLNFPVIGRATPEKVTGSVCSGCTVEVFLADAGKGAYGEGKTFVSSATANSDGTFAVTVSGVAEGNYVTATATDAAGNTSEFSPNQAVIMNSDTTPPETTIDSGPQEGTTTSGSVTFAFSSSEPGSSFECSLDGAAFSPCASPKDYNVADGPHTFEVKATDPEGNADTTPDSRTWTVDATAPAIQAPVQGLVNNSTLGTSTVPVKLTWSATDSGTGVAEYKLQQSINGGGFTTVPISTTGTTTTRQLSPGTTYQFRVQARDQVGNWSDWSHGSSFTVNDHQETSSGVAYVGTWTSEVLSSAYGGSVNYATGGGAMAQLRFASSSVAWVTTKHTDRGKATVWIDGVKVATVDLYSSTKKSRMVAFTRDSLDPSQIHTLEVRVTGTKNAASSGTRVDVDAFVLLSSDGVAPGTTINSGPTGTIGSNSATFEFSSVEENSTFECKLDGGAYVNCSSPKTYDNLADGDHTFNVRATDAAGNTDGSPAEQSFRVDATGPDTAIDSGPQGPTNDDTPTYSWSGSDSLTPSGNLVYSWRLDSGDWSPYSSDTSVTLGGLDGLADGSYTFQVRAKDQAGNVDQSPADRTFTVDTVAPDAPVITNPANDGYNADGEFTVSGTAEANSTVELFDGSTSQGTTTADANNGDWSFSLTGVAEGSHAYTAKATDAAGNTSAASNTRTVIVDATAPETTIDSGPSGTVSDASGE